MSFSPKVITILLDESTISSMKCVDDGSEILLDQIKVYDPSEFNHISCLGGDVPVAYDHKLRCGSRVHPCCRSDEDGRKPQ